MVQQTINIALFGTGGVANMHAQGLQSSDQGNLLGAYSRNPENVARFCEQYGIRGYHSLEQILEDPNVDAIIIASPVATHVPTALACLKAGKHVLVEKPLAPSLDEVLELKVAAEQSGKVCMPNHNYIYSPQLIRAKQAINENQLGKLSSMWLMYNQKHWPEMGSPGLTLIELCIHHIYTMLYLLGRPLRISAVGSNIFFDDPKAADQISIQAEFESGVIANLWGSFGVDDKTSNPWSVFYKVLGTEGGFSHSWNDLQYGEATQPGWDLAGYKDSFLYSQNHFLNECIGKGKQPLSTLDDTLDAFAILNAAEVALAERRWVDVDYPHS